MTNKMIEVCCPHCGQRMGLYDTAKTEFTCINCKTIQPVANAVPKRKRLSLTEKEFVDIFMHPNKYPQSKAIAVIMTLVTLPVDKWPKEIQEKYNQYKKNRRNRLVIMYTLLLLFYILILLEVFR